MKLLNLCFVFLDSPCRDFFAERQPVLYLAAAPVTSGKSGIAALEAHGTRYILKVMTITIELGQIAAHLVSLTIAYALAFPIGWNREKAARTAGLRTFPLVAMASCGFILIARQVARDSPEAQARIIEGLMTGIGFIGGGAILKESGSVRGTATAASIWNTGAIGAAVAYGYYEIALVLTIINFLTLQFLTPLGETLRSRKDFDQPGRD